MQEKRNWFVLSHSGRKKPDLDTGENKVWSWQISAIGPFTEEEAKALASNGREGTLLEQSDRKSPSDVLLEHLLKSALEGKELHWRMLEIAEKVEGLDLDKIDALLTKEIEEGEDSG